MKRDTHLVFGMLLVMVAIVVIVRFPVRVGAPAVAPAPVENQPAAVIVPFTELARGMKSKVAVRVNYLITSADDFNKLWQLVDAKGEPPEVDFDKDAVIAVFAGQQPTAGYAITVSKIVDSSARLVSVTIKKPDDSCVVGQVLTTPYELVTIPATTLPLAHEDFLATTSCSE